MDESVQPQEPGQALVPITDLLPELREQQYAYVLDLHERRMKLADHYDVQDGECLIKIRDVLAGGKNAGSGLWTRYLDACGLPERTARYRIQKAEGRVTKRTPATVAADSLPEGKKKDAPPTQAPLPVFTPDEIGWQPHAFALGAQERRNQDTTEPEPSVEDQPTTTHVEPEEPDEEESAVPTTPVVATSSSSSEATTVVDIPDEQITPIDEDGEEVEDDTDDEEDEHNWIKEWPEVREAQLEAQVGGIVIALIAQAAHDGAADVDGVPVRELASKARASFEQCAYLASRAQIKWFEALRAAGHPVIDPIEAPVVQSVSAEALKAIPTPEQVGPSACRTAIMWRMAINIRETSHPFHHRTLDGTIVDEDPALAYWASFLTDAPPAVPLNRDYYGVDLYRLDPPEPPTPPEPTPPATPPTNPQRGRHHRSARVREALVAHPELKDLSARQAAEAIGIKDHKAVLVARRELAEQQLGG